MSNLIVFRSQFGPGVFLTDFKFWADNLETALKWLNLLEISHTHKGMVVLFTNEEDLGVFLLRWQD